MISSVQVCLKQLHTRNRHVHIIFKCISSHCTSPLTPKKRTRPPRQRYFSLAVLVGNQGKWTFICCLWVRKHTFSPGCWSESRVVIPTKSPKKKVMSGDKFITNPQLLTTGKGEILGYFVQKSHPNFKQHGFFVGRKSTTDQHATFSRLRGGLRNWHICPFWS